MLDYLVQFWESSLYVNFDQCCVQRGDHPSSSEDDKILHASLPELVIKSSKGNLNQKTNFTIEQD